MLLFLVLLVSCSYKEAVAQPKPLWHVGYPVGTYGQVDSVTFTLPSSRVFASLFTSHTDAYSVDTGASVWGQGDVFEGIAVQSVAARKGDTIVNLDVVVNKTQVLFVTRYSASSSPPLKPTWQKIYPAGYSQMIQVSEDGKLVVVGVNTDKGSNTYSGIIYILDGVTGVIKNQVSCPGTPSVTNMLLSLDPSGKVFAYSCWVKGSRQSTLYVQDIDAAAPFFSIPSIPASGTGFAISNGGDWFAFGVEQLWVYKRVGNTYHLYFQRDPIPSQDARLVEAIAFDADPADDGKTVYLAAGYFMVDPASKTQRSLLEVYNLAVPASKPLWSFWLGNTTSPLQDSIGELRICNGKYLSMASWGTASPATPTFHVFALSSSTPIVAFNTPGSMFSTDCVVVGSDLWVSVGGKREHANVFGSGGDLYTWKLPL